MTAIFERTIAGRHPDDMVFIKMDCSSDTPLAYVIPIEINIEESFSAGSFVLTMTVSDGAGTLMHYKLPDYEDTFTVGLGNTPGKSEITMGLKIVSIEQINDNIGKTESVVYRITMIHQGWFSFSGVVHNRGWDNKLYSDIVNIVAGECGYAGMDIKPTDAEKEFIIQPHITNAEMLRWLRQRSKHPMFDDAFEYGVNIKGEFFFKTISDWIDEQRGDSYPVLTLQGVHENDGARLAAKAANGNVPPHFFMFENTERYMDGVMNRGSKVISSFYDFEKAEYKTEEFKYSDMVAWQLSDWGAQKTAHHDNTGIRNFHGSDPDVHSYSKTRLTETINSQNSLRITTEGTYEVQIGRILEIVFPTDMNHPIITNPISEFYSGFYMVTGVTHRFQMTHNKYYTDFTLMRQGFDGKGLSGMIKSALGRFI